MQNENIKNTILQKTEEIPPIPQILPVLLKLIDRKNPPIQSIQDIIMTKDVEMSRKIKELKEKGLSTYNIITDTVFILSLTTLKNLIFTPKFLKESSAKEMSAFKITQNELWNHSRMVAITSKIIAQEINFYPVEIAFVTGLFHDQGRIILNVYGKSEIDKIIKLTKAKAYTLYNLEDQVFGFNHSYLGARIARKWGLPSYIVEAINYHHDPHMATERQKLVEIVHLADGLISSYQTHLPLKNLFFPIDQLVLSNITIEESRLYELAKASEEYFEKLKQMV